MRRRAALLTTAALLFATTGFAQVAPAGPGLTPDLEPRAVLRVMTTAADWQLAHPSTHPPYDWTQAAFYTGVMALADVSGDAKYLAAMRAMGEANQWRPGLRPGHADDYVVVATYARLFQIDKDKRMLTPGLALFNFLVSRPYNEPLAWGNSIETRELAWCDALFMGPPALAAVSAATGDRKYLDLANRLWWKTTDAASLPNPETSGTGFFTYSLAWGINKGLLDRAKHEPSVRRGWTALVKAMQPDGMLGWVQRIGDKPGATSQETTEVYGVGALLLAGSEVYRLAGGK